MIRSARQWYGHAAGLFLLWTRLGAPWAALAGWLGGARGGLGSQVRLMALAGLAAPIAAGAYAAGYMLARRLLVVRLHRLKTLDAVLLAFTATAGAFSVAAAVPSAERPWLLLPAAGLFGSAWILNWWHEGAETGPGPGEAPAAPAFCPPAVGPVTAGYRSYDRSHTGVDLGVPEGTPVRAPAAGRVVHAGPLEQWGYAVMLDHGGGWTTLFAHLERPGVKRGLTVRPGDLIGWSGTSGISTGPHLHVELRYQGTPVDPAAMLPT